ncbi:MAG TPA: helix-hairpin-helix domain-containing protein, partial [Thermoanaerobaculia bacterium]|nr:helix-hairpin-helix domain-containing protein [Thermoanaerobaculia bacterium]
MTRERPRAGGVRPGSPLRDLPGVGPATARRLAAAGYETVGELLGHLPHRYEDRTTIATVAEALAAWAADPAARKVTVQGTLEGVRRLRLGRRGLSLVRGRLRDATGTLPVVWFNRPYLPAQLVEGVEYLLHGELRAAPRGPAGGAGSPELLNPSCEPAERALLAGGVVPVYPAAGEL